MSSASHGVGNINGNGQRLLDFCATNSLLISNTWFCHKTLHQCTWYRNGDRFNPGHMIYYLLIGAKFCSSILDTCVYRGVHHISDHELVVSTLRFKIKAKRHQCHQFSPLQTKQLPREVVASFRASLADAYNSYHTSHSNSSHPPDAADVWISFKGAVQDASDHLLPLPRKKEVDWITDEVRNLSKKKKSAWLHLRDLTNKDNDQYKITLAEYCRFRRLTKVAAEKARNARCSARAVEAEKKAWVAQQQGRGGSLIKDLRLLKRQASKPYPSYLLAKDNTIISSDRQVATLS